MKIKLREEAVFKVDENGDIIIINVMDEDDFYYRIHGIACEVFNALHSGHSSDEARDMILRDYDTSEAIVQKDIDSLISDLKKYGLAEVS